ncbi:hypothetical protein SDC9_78206 [bioreactor metagenome]|uniref:Uncharacterized protein n=1 Tax=bioreactor metagenome TaxID=1076179 RepID=A0A644YSW5_9ZZZZ
MPYHESSYRVPYADTDQMGVVYYANYLEYFERSRTEMLRDAGLPYSELERLGYYLPVREAHLQYESGARYDDLLIFRSQIAEARGARLVIVSEVRRGDELLVSGSVTLACVNRERRITRLPAVIFEAIQKLSAETD